MLQFLIIFCFILSVTGLSTEQAKNMDLDSLIEQDLIQLSKTFGYRTFQYELLTEDGYYLTMFRFHKSEILKKNVYPMFMIHGLLGCANNWILNARESLPFLLADMGYDIWLPNARGTTFSLKHTKYNSTEKNYWKFSWHEIGVYDMPVSIDKVLNETGFSKVFVVGHSEGATDFFAMAAALPEYDKKTHFSLHMAPPVFLSDIPIPLLRSIGPYYKWLERLADTIGLFTFVPDTPMLADSLIFLCKTAVVDLCDMVVRNLFMDHLQINGTMLPYVFSKVPCGGSIREALHYLQNIYTGGFNYFDHGPKKNLKLYNSTTAPPYNLAGVKSKVGIFYGQGDVFARKIDIEKLVSHLPNVAFVHPAHNQNWTHMDFLLAIDVFKISYQKAIDVIERENIIDD